jgi:hypothetical protein
MTFERIAIKSPKIRIRFMNYLKHNLNMKMFNIFHSFFMLIEVFIFFLK